MAHFLHNLLYLAGPATDRSAMPASVEGELYRAHPIESCDTAMCRVALAGNLELVCLASHATAEAIQPRFRLEFEDATITCGEDTRTVVARIRGGGEIDYGAPDDTPQFKKLHDAIHAVHLPFPVVVCGPEAASAQTLAVNGLHESARNIVPFPEPLVRRSGVDASVDGLGQILVRCYQEGRLPSELGVAWASPGARVDLTRYQCFPSLDCGRSEAP